MTQADDLPSTAESGSPLAIKSVLHTADLSNILAFCESRHLGMFLPRRNLLVSTQSSWSCCHSELSYRNMELTPLVCELLDFIT